MRRNAHIPRETLRTQGMRARFVARAGVVPTALVGLAATTVGFVLTAQVGAIDVSGVRPTGHRGVQAQVNSPVFAPATADPRKVRVHVEPYSIPIALHAPATAPASAARADHLATPEPRRAEAASRMP